jgi:hypothetical protein
VRGLTQVALARSRKAVDGSVGMRCKLTFISRGKLRHVLRYGNEGVSAEARPIVIEELRRKRRQNLCIVESATSVLSETRNKLKVFQRMVSTTDGVLCEMWNPSA